MSFGQEIKDFLSAAAAGQKIMGATSDEEYKKAKMRYMAAQTKTLEDKNNDEEGDKLTKDAQRALIRSREAATGLTNERRGLVKDQRGVLAAPSIPPSLQALPGQAPAGGVPTERPAAPPAIDPNVGMDLSSADPLDDETEAVPVAMAARGGSIQRFADGGAVEEDDEEDDEEAEAIPDDEEAEAGPGPAVGASVATDISARSRGVPKFSTDAGVDAGASGLKYGVSALGLNKPAAVADPGRQRRLTAYARGAGAAAPIDMDAARKAVDPDNKLSESQRNLAALGAVYQFKLNKDDQAGAQRAAFSMIQHYRVASQQYAAITAAAVEKGDLDGAAKAAMKAYANIPDGKDLKIEKTADGKFKYSFTDEKTGKTLEAGIESPDKLAAAAIGFARQGFDQSLMAAAGQRAEKPAKGKGAVDPNAPMKTADKKAALAGIDAAYESANPADAGTEGGGAAKAPRSKDEERALKGASFRISTNSANGNMTHDEALAVATKIADPAALGKSTLKVDKAEGGYTVTIDGRHPTFVSADDMGSLMEQRNAKKAEATKAAEEAAKPGAVSKLTKAAGEFIQPAVDYMTKTADGPARRKQEAARKTFTEPSIP